MKSYNGDENWYVGVWLLTEAKKRVEVDLSKTMNAKLPLRWPTT